MKFRKKLLFFLLLPFLALASCGGNPYVGTYKFAMGKQSGSHFSVTLNLSDEVYVAPTGYEVPEEAKCAHLSGDFSFGDLPEAIAAFIANLLQTGVDLYYVVETEYHTGKNPLHLGDPMIDEALKVILPMVLDIPDDINYLELVIVTYISGNIVSMYIPVSMKDLQLQLAWYGYLVDDNFTSFKQLSMPMKEKKIGTHPTLEEVIDFNHTYKADLEAAGWSEDFRDFHTLDFGLTKE